MAKPDANFRSYADETDLVLTDLTVDPALDGLDPASFDDLVKLSHVQRARVTGLIVRGAGRNRENGIDLNRECEDIVIDGAQIEAGRQNAITIKGGCRRITLRNIVITRAGGNCDIELGNWSDQSAEPVREVVFENVRRFDGLPVRLRVGHADRPKIEGGKIKLQFWASLALKAYVQFRLLLSRVRAGSL